MIGKLILTHGGLAKELLAAAQVISGRLAGFEALSLDWSEGLEQAKEKIGAAIGRLDEGQGVLILTDMYGGTPCNLALSFLAPGRVEILSGVNLPMVLRLACQTENGNDLQEVARRLQSKAQRSVCLASDMATGCQPEKCETKTAKPET